MPRVHVRAGDEVVLYGLRGEGRRFNGRRCSVLPVLPAEDEAEMGAAAVAEDDGRGGQNLVVRVAPDDAILSTGRDDELGGVCLVVTPRQCFPNTESGRRQLQSERAADVLALRGAFAPFFAGLAGDIAPNIAAWLKSPERLMVFSGYRGKIYNTVHMFSNVSGRWETP